MTPVEAIRIVHIIMQRAPVLVTELPGVQTALNVLNDLADPPKKDEKPPVPVEPAKPSQHASPPPSPRTS